MYNEIVSFTKNVHDNGVALEERVQTYLESQHIPFKRFKNNGIDFIINGCFHMDCIAQSVSGSIGDKLPHKCWKYIKRYNLSEDIYILHPYSPIKRQVGEHLEEIENSYGCRIHILDWKDFTYLMDGGTFSKRKPYVYHRSGKGVSNLPPITAKINEFFCFKK